MQHLVGRNSNVATGTSAVVLNPDYITEVRWWEHPDFGDPSTREAAELVAFEVLDPVLKSRDTIHDQARQLYDDKDFRDCMHCLVVSLVEGWSS